MDIMTGFGTALAIMGVAIFVAGAAVVGILWWALG